MYLLCVVLVLLILRLLAGYALSSVTSYARITDLVICLYESVALCFSVSLPIRTDPGTTEINFKIETPVEVVSLRGRSRLIETYNKIRKTHNKLIERFLLNLRIIVA